MLGNGYESRTVRSFNCQYSMQNRGLPSGFGMSTTGLAHSLWLGSISMSLSIRSTRALMSSLVRGPIR